jgi:hypothetical protein
LEEFDARAVRELQERRHVQGALLRVGREVMSGSSEVTAGGETRRFDTGDVLLAEDTSGPGRATKVIRDTVVAVVRV